MLIDAANVDPFLEGRRPRHVWSHQLRLRPASTAAENGNGGTSPMSSCLGPSGEQALFESLSSGAEGAFVVWAKGGHETRQECKRLVVDVLDLLAAPGGQAPGFFRRGALARGPPAGRVGIAASAPSKTATATARATGPVVPAAEKGSGGDGWLPSSNGDDHPTPMENDERNQEAEAAGTTSVRAGPAVEGHGPEGEQARLEGVEDDGGKDSAAEKGGAPGLTYGYASLRKIREREPLPEVTRDHNSREKVLVVWCGSSFSSPFL